MNSGIFQSQGILKYSNTKLIVEVDQGISDFYKSLVPKYYEINPQKYAAHISVVRNETPPKMEFWKKYDGKIINFEYTNTIYRGTVYWWLNAFSTELEEIRVELGLPVSSMYTRPPEGFEKVFHITLGNTKPKP